ncbi:Clp protease N-terminal domain-containing protein [Streptomyces sp. NPDC002490]|uniref:Clp protease N-terminal domain-containing protein n=1 Tax=Streptomyces sp. NPDC002490 TaxID=3154416 RepID=UPI003325A391
MHLSFPQQPALRAAGPPPDDLLDVEVRSAVAGARRRAVRDGDRHVDTAHLLHSLLETDPLVRALFGDGPQLARLLGYLVQRSIGYGRAWRSSTEDRGPFPPPRATRGPHWSPAAVAALERAVLHARARGATRASGVDLCAALVDDRESRAVDVLSHVGIEHLGRGATSTARGSRNKGREGCETGHS